MVLHDWLVGLPVWLQALMVIGVASMGSLAVTALFRTITGAHHEEGHNEVLGLVFATCGVIYAVLLAFVVFAVYTQYTRADGIVDDEAATLAALYYDTERYPEPVRSATQQSIRGYTRSVVDDEFPRMQRGEASPSTREWLNRLNRLNAGLRPGDPYSVQLDSNANRLVDNIALLRDERLEASRAALPWTFWLTLTLGGVGTVALASLLVMRQASHQLFGSFVLGLVIGSVLFLILVLDRPFTGTTAIRSGAFQRSLQLYSSIDDLNRQPPGQAVSRGAAARARP
jgi:hypothetical protein